MYGATVASWKGQVLKAACLTMIEDICMDGEIGSIGWPYLEIIYGPQAFIDVFMCPQTDIYAWTKYTRTGLLLNGNGDTYARIH